MNSHVAKSDSLNKCPSFLLRLSAFSRANFAFCRAFPFPLAIIYILLSFVASTKGSLFFPPHLVPAASPFARADFRFKNAHFFRVVVHPPPFPFSLPFSPLSPRPSANSAPIPTQRRSFEPSQKTWRVVLGEICQLPNLLRPTENSSTFAECEKLDWGIAELLNRSDLGFWRLRFCESDTLFVPSSQRCLTRRSVLLQNEICSKKSLRESIDENETLGENGAKELATNYSLCPPGDSLDLWMTVRQKVPTKQKRTEEKVPEGQRREFAKTEEEEEEDESAEEDGTNSDLEMVEPCRVRIGEKGKGKSMHQLAKCPCESDNCICMESQLPRLFSACCCPTKQSSPCLCPIAPPHFVTTDDKLLSANKLAQQKAQALALAPQQKSQESSNKIFEEENSVGPPEDFERFVPFPSGVEQPRQCPLIDQTKPQVAHYQRLCSWMLDPLVADSESRTHFLQCQPTPFSLFCGRWQRMPCAPKTVFEVKEQMCIWEDNQQQQRGEKKENEIFPYQNSVGRSEQQQNVLSPSLCSSPFPFLALRCPSPRGQ
ncbi:hypothetical protein niasHS_007300 [Heterodera schachtii]|uniref:Uncharacterized protein n=1 Tax=Heterodera schachtii TaxID=97005 RepID=A0ABD2JK29_HETSC